MMMNAGCETSSPGASPLGGLERTSTEYPRGPKVHTSFRINPVVELFAGMKGEKEKILGDIGLHGLTELPREDPTKNRSFDWQFAFWLLRQLDSETGSLDLGARGCLDMRCEDVELVTGIPCAGAELKKSDPLMLQATRKLVKQGLLLEPGDDLSLENIRKVLEREITPETDAGQRRAFVMAAFLFAVSYFLAPKGRPAKVNTEILECILDTGNLKNINWASYVLMSLREASAKLKKELVAKTKSVTLDGCLLLLQVVYLDNIDFGVSSTKHDVIPRIKDFSFDKLHELINADKKTLGGAGVARFGARQLRDDHDSLYTRGDLYRSILMSKQKISSGLLLESDKDQILEYVKKNVDEGKRRVRIASRQFEEHASNTLDQCHLKISTLLDMWLTKGVISVGKRKAAHNIDASVSGGEEKEVYVDGGSARTNPSKRRYKTVSKRRSRVGTMETLGADPAAS